MKTMFFIEQQFIEPKNVFVYWLQKHLEDVWNINFIVHSRWRHLKKIQIKNIRREK